MMPLWKRNIFVRVVTKRMAEERRTAEEILNEYTALTEEEKQEILAVIVAQLEYEATKEHYKRQGGVKMFEIIKRNYEKGLWTKQMVAIAVKKGVITAEQYKEITGEEYVA